MIEFSAMWASLNVMASRWDAAAAPAISTRVPVFTAAEKALPRTPNVLGGVTSNSGPSLPFTMTYSSRVGSRKLPVPVSQDSGPTKNGPPMPPSACISLK